MKKNKKITLIGKPVDIQNPLQFMWITGSSNDIVLLNYFYENSRKSFLKERIYEADGSIEYRFPIWWAKKVTEFVESCVEINLEKSDRNKECENNNTLMLTGECTPELEKFTRFPRKNPCPLRLKFGDEKFTLVIKNLNFPGYITVINEKLLYVFLPPVSKKPTVYMRNLQGTDEIAE